MQQMKVVFLSVLLAILLNAAYGSDFSTYATGGHAKAQGVSIAMDFPATWVANDSSEPGVVHEFRDPTTGGRDALIVVVPLQQPSKPTPKTFRESFQSAKAQEHVAPGARHRTKEFVEGLEFPCMVFDYDLEIPQLAPAVIQVRNYILLVGDKMVQVQFYGVAPPAEDIRIGRAEMMNHIIKSIKRIAREDIRPLGSETRDVHP